ncbi:MAG: carboxypeptidase regulatory-like domain-containing protein, partial [Myxococcales bacterium]|nr:carboxypeptidase regulatory-like domain-containing protein [Myxococcales bacterium]
PTKVGAVDVPEGDVADLGTITVEPGRAVSGRVLDADGAPVVGAEVAAGRLLTGGGAELYIENESVVAQSTRTDEDGRFTMTGFLPAPITLVAGLDGVGRSASVTIPRGKASVEVDLVLIATGGVDGVITRDGQPLADTAVIANPVGATRSNFFVVTGPDGTFALDQLAAGSYVIYPMIGGGGNRPKDMYVHLIDVAAGARTAVTIDATPGPIALTVAARTDAGAPVTVAPVVVTQPVIAAPTMEALADGATLPPELLAGGTLTMYIRTIMGAPVEIAGVALGPHSVCVTPLPVGDDSSRAMALMDRVDQLPMKCVPYTVTAAPAAQTVTVEVPAAWAAPPATP